jgi:DNA (cytosine-5)-methyltransferase 1
MRLVSLFSGCGGLDLGFKREGYDLLWANDFDKDICATYSLNLGDHMHNVDITNVKNEEIPECDIIIGGPPCQSFSLAGRRDIEDERGNLVWEFYRIVKSKKPKVFLMENVTGIKSAKLPDGKKVLDTLVSDFEKLDYTVSVHTLNAADYGVPQRRKRVFVVGHYKGVTIEAPTPTNSQNGLLGEKWVSSKDALSDLSKPTDDGIARYLHAPDNDYQKYLRGIGLSKTGQHIIPYSSPKDREIISYVKPGGNYMDVPDEVATTRIMNFKRTGGRTTTYGRLDPAMPAYTINTHFNRPNVGCNIHYIEDRMITLREGLRLQSFPDDFVLTGTSKRSYYIQVGNAVPALLGWAWAKHLKQYVDKGSNIK